MEPITSTLLIAAFSGTLLGVSSANTNPLLANSVTSTALMHSMALAGAKHACKGQNACKGQGGCKTDKHACKGQNACKGQGGCKTS
jgi:hypothetical protein